MKKQLLKIIEYALENDLDFYHNFVDYGLCIENYKQKHSNELIKLSQGLEYYDGNRYFTIDT